ncbi:hypothetical protein QE152_g37417 [Popillia japonica]|uniref:Phage protein n=1 Tax=Popillia japonica TaxID=7064 RepID=A0AAW1I9Y8_POPJA
MNKLQYLHAISDVKPNVRNITDVKTNVLCITAIGTLNGQVYAVPDEYQPVTFHKEIVKLAAFNKVKNSLTKRHQTRKVWINVTEELAKIYLDEGENLQIGDFYLEEITDKLAKIYLDEGENLQIEAPTSSPHAPAKLYYAKQIERLLGRRLRFLISPCLRTEQR